MSTLEYTGMDSIVSLTNDRATCILVIRYESKCIVLGDYSIVHHLRTPVIACTPYAVMHVRVSALIIHVRLACFAMQRKSRNLMCK